MQVRRRISRMFESYRMAHVARKNWQNSAWRLFVVLLLIGALLALNEYIGYKLLADYLLMDKNIPLYLIQDKIFYWMAVGTVLGIVATTFMYEGELLIGIYKNLKHAEKDALAEISRQMMAFQKGKAKTPSRRKKKAK